MPTIHEHQCVDQLISIINDQSNNDIQKADLARKAIESFKDHGIDIRQVVQNFGDVESPVRLSILKSLPRTFGVFHAMGGEMTQFDKRNRTPNHSFADLVELMEKVEAFSSDEPGNFGYGGVIKEYDRDTYSWLFYYAGELDIEVCAERARAKIDMRNEGIIVPIFVGRENEAEECLIFSRRPSGKLECRPNEIPDGNIKQEYIKDEKTGYMRFKPEMI